MVGVGWRHDFSRERPLRWHDLAPPSCMGWQLPPSSQSPPHSRSLPPIANGTAEAVVGTGVAVGEVAAGTEAAVGAAAGTEAGEVGVAGDGVGGRASASGSPCRQLTILLRPTTHRQPTIRHRPTPEPGLPAAIPAGTLRVTMVVRSNNLITLTLPQLLLTTHTPRAITVGRSNNPTMPTPLPLIPTTAARLTSQRLARIDLN